MGVEVRSDRFLLFVRLLSAILARRGPLGSRKIEPHGEQRVVRAQDDRERRPKDKEDARGEGVAHVGEGARRVEDAVVHEDEGVDGLECDEDMPKRPTQERRLRSSIHNSQVSRLY